MEGRQEDWYGNKSYRLEDVGGPQSLDKISRHFEIGENENTVVDKFISENILVNDTPNNVPSEVERNRDTSAIHSSNPALQERSQHEENNVLADGNRNCEMAERLLSSSKELPSWAMRQTASVPPNTHRIAECQGCMKGHGAPHTCDIKEEVPSRFSDMSSGVYPIPSNRHAMMPPTIMNPYAPAWSEGHEVYPPSWRHLPQPPWRQDQNPYQGRHGYEKHYCEECEDEYIRHYPLDARGRHHMHDIHEAPRVPPHHDAYLPQINHGHSYGLMHETAFLRPRHMEEHPPPSSHFHQYPARKYPFVPLSGQGLTGSEWQSRSLQNCSMYEPPQVCTDSFVDSKNSRGEWPTLQLEQTSRTYDTTPYSDASSLSQSVICATENSTESQSDKPEIYQTHSLADDFNAKSTLLSKTKTYSERQEVVSSAESNITFNEKNRSAPPADDLTTPHLISSSTSSNNNNNNMSITLNKDPADSHTTVNEAVKSDEDALSMKTSSVADSSTPVDIIKQETPYTRKSPCAFTVDFSPTGSSAADSFSVSKLPANLAKRVAKFPRKKIPKDDKSEKSLQANATVIHQKKPNSLNSIKQLADDKDKQSSKVKQLQHVHSNYTEDDDFDDDSKETYQERLRWSKSMAWTKVDANSTKNDHYFKSPESGLRGTSVTPSRVKSKMRSDDNQPGKMNKSLEFERPSVNTDNPSVVNRKYAPLEKFSNYSEQNSHNVSFETEEDSSSVVSETETYTICTAEQDRAVIAAREKIGEVFRVGIKDDLSETEVHDKDSELLSNSFVSDFIDDQNSHTEEEDISESDNSLQLCKQEDSPELENFTELTTAVEASKRKPEDVVKKSQEDLCLDMKDSDDVICLTHDSNKDSLGDRKSKHLPEINLVSSFSMSPLRGTSLSKRMLPRVPGKDGLADNRSDAGDSDTGFFEVLSCDAPVMRPVEKKKAGWFEVNCCISETYQKPHTDGEFEVIADAPRVVENAGLNEDKSLNDNTMDFLHTNKVMKNGLNKRGPSSSSQSEDDELKKIYYDTRRSGKVIGMTATDEHESISDHKPTLHTRTGKLHSTPRFYDTLLPNETSLNHSQKPQVNNSITTSKNQTNGTSNHSRMISANEGFVPISFGRSSVRSEGRKLPGSPTKPMHNTKSEFISRGRGGFDSGVKGSLRETRHEGFDSISNSSLSQPSTPRLNHRLSSKQSQKLTENAVESRPPLSGSRQKTVVSKAVSHSSAVMAEPGTPPRAPYVRQRSLSRPSYSRGDPQLSLSRPPMSRDDPTRQQPQFSKHSSFDRTDMTQSMPPNRSKQHQVFKGQRLGETPMSEKATSYDNEARMKRSKSVSTVLRSRTSDVENPKLQAYHERMKYDPKKAIEDSKKLRLSASSRSDDTDASSYEELQNHHLTRNRPGSMTHSRKTSDYQPRTSFKQSGTRPRSARTRLSSDEVLNQSTSSDVDAAYGIHPTIPSIQNLSEDIHQLLNKIKQDKTRAHSITQPTSLSANRATSSVDDPQLNELHKTLKKVKQVLQSKFHS